jgi:hypothetical protein
LKVCFEDIKNVASLASNGHKTFFMSLIFNCVCACLFVCHRNSMVKMKCFLSCFQKVLKLCSIALLLYWETLPLHGDKPCQFSPFLRGWGCLGPYRFAHSGLIICREENFHAPTQIVG